MHITAYVALAIIISMVCGSPMNRQISIQQDQDVNEGVDIPSEYIVVLHKDTNEASFAAHIAASIPSVQILGQFNIENTFKAFTVNTTDHETIRDLKNDPSVNFIERNAPCAVAFTQSNAPWNLARISSRLAGSTTNYVYDNSAGYGVNVYIIDTGIQTTHEEFQGRASWGANFINYEPAQDLHGHGTHVAGIVGALTWGVAKRTNLIAVKVLDHSGHGSWNTVIAGINWLVLPKADQFGIEVMLYRAFSAYRASGCRSVINISISGSYSAALNAAITAAIQGGTHVAIAAGNDAVNACTESPSSDTAGFVVGSIGQNDAYSTFSNFGGCVDIFAPGENIISTWIGASNQVLAKASGTSASSPHVAGVKALFLADRDWMPSDLDAELRNVATKNPITSLPQGTVSFILYSNPPTSMQDKEQEQGTFTGEGDAPMESSAMDLLVSMLHRGVY